MSKVSINITKQQYDQWLTDLRSGEFKQARSALYDGHGYCCLGVLANRLPEAKMVHEPAEDYSRSNHFGFRFGDGFAQDYIPNTFIPHSLQQFLAYRNDGSKEGGGDDGDAPIRKHSFAEIADLIEETMEPRR